MPPQTLLLGPTRARRRSLCHKTRTTPVTQRIGCDGRIVNRVDRTLAVFDLAPQEWSRGGEIHVTTLNQRPVQVPNRLRGSQPEVTARIDRGLAGVLDRVSKDSRIAARRQERAISAVRDAVDPVPVCPDLEVPARPDQALVG